MKSNRMRRVAAIFGTVAAVACVPALGQPASFTGLGDLGGGMSKAYAVSSDGKVAVGESLDSNGKTQAFIWTSANGIKGIGFLNATYQDSRGRGVDVDSGGAVHVTGYSKNSSDKNQAFHWSGDTLGAGTMSAIPFLTGGSESYGRALRIKSTDETFIVGKSEKTGDVWHAFLWTTGEPDSEDLGDVYGAHDGPSDALGIGWRPSSGTLNIAGYGNSNWGLTGHRREASRWDPTWGMLGRRGLDYVCGRGFQVAAGDNGTADTTADPDDIQVIAQGTTSLDPEEIIVSSGYDYWLQTRWEGDQIQGDDQLRPEGLSDDGSSESLFNAMSPDGRFSVGRCKYPDATCGDDHPKVRLFQANLHDVKLNDGDPGGSHCSASTVKHFPLGFVGDDNYSEAFGVSRSSEPEPSRDGVVAVGWSKNVGYGIVAGANGEAESTAQCDDIQEVAVGTTGLSSDTMVVSSGPNGLLNTSWSGDDKRSASYGINGSEKKAFVSFISNSYDPFDIQIETQDLKAYLENEGLDLTGWELREARGVSDYGSVVVGLGLHNGVEEGFIASLPGIPGPVGACCHDDASCTMVPEYQCPGRWKGEGSTCETVTCCPFPWADADNDNDVDQVDFGLWQACFTGSDGGVNTGCECYDRDDADGSQKEAGSYDDVDMTDFGWFENCFMGPEVPLDLENLPEDCIP